MKIPQLHATRAEKAFVGRERKKKLFIDLGLEMSENFGKFLGLKVTQVNIYKLLNQV